MGDGPRSPKDSRIMNTRHIGIITALILALPALTPRVSPAQQSIQVVYDDGRSSEQVQAWHSDPESEEWYLRANDVARIFKATQFWNASSRKVVLGVDRNRFTLTVDTRVVVVDGEPVMLKNTVRYDAGFVMIPMEFVIEVASPYTPSVFDWDPQAMTLHIQRVGYNVQSIAFTTTENRSTATITLSEPLIHHVDSSTPGLVRLKLYGGRIDPTKFEVHEDHGLFSGVRAEQTDRDAYLYFDIKKVTSRILIEREDTTPPTLNLILEKGELPEIPEPDFAGKKNVEIVDRLATGKHKLSIRTVVLDPGHGGKDNGKVGRGGTTEKSVNLILAKKTRDLLEQQLGVRVVLTREDDRLLSLTGRTEIANQAKGDLFISIHCNSWFSGETGGFEAYFLAPARTEWDRTVAMAENSADELANPGAKISSDIDFIVWDMVQNEYINESSYFAETIQKIMGERLSIRSRGVKQANFVVLQGAQMPAVLIETAFLSNATEEALLNDEDFQQKVAQGIVEAVRKFRERYE
jgi:N-acetylmuramoyl-L-alanine amidase